MEWQHQQLWENASVVFAGTVAFRIFGLIGVCGNKRSNGTERVKRSYGSLDLTVDHLCQTPDQL